ncbi:hypothetical protein ACGFZQ_39175 [Streptomyces sp. NPDC048254]|uniref:hypothetical protein n=1 Tax=Streptomyces sp. NPDC048254 TaxID=3365525 RepID=UPI00371C102F
MSTPSSLRARVFMAIVLVCLSALTWYFPAQQVVRYTSGHEARTVRVTGREDGECRAVWVFPGGHRASGKVPADYCNDEYTGEEFAIFAGEDWGVREHSDLLWSAAQQLTLIVPGVLLMWLLGRAWERRRLATPVQS